MLIELVDRRWGECRLCKLLRNPYYAPAAYLARFCVNLATIIWAAIVLWQGETISSELYIYHKQMLSVMPMRVWSAFAMFASLCGLCRLVWRCHPAWWGAIGYSLMMLFWVYIDAAIILVDSIFMSAVGIASITAVAFLSVYAAASHAHFDSKL